MQNVGPKNRVVFILLRNPYIGGQKLSNPSLNNNLFLSIFTSLLHSFVVSCLFNHFSLLLFQNIRPFLSISTITVIPLLDHVGFRSLLISTRSFSDPSIFSASLLSSSRVRDADCSRSYETLHPLWSHWPFPRQAPERWTFCGPSNF